ncbi:MAG: CPBP family intramembrane metalloprotease [Anaerolineales bacterium]|nr:MAG: CPBP family intramembrane metalloprotease [Anaerolineales bacterium]
MRLNQLKMDWKVVTTIVVSTLLLVLHHYRRPWDYWPANSLFYWLVIPLVFIMIVYRERPSEYGFRLGDWKAGLALTAAAWAGITLMMFVLARTDVLQSYYGSGNDSLGTLILDKGLDLLGWEFLFRGFLLFALYRVCGPYAIILQAVPFTIAHWDKPELETLSCIFGGSAFGYVAWRTRSFLYPFLIHWFLSCVTVVFAGGVA